MSTQGNRLHDLEARLERIEAALQFEFGINLDDPVDDLEFVEAEADDVSDEIAPSSEPADLAEEETQRKSRPGPGGYHSKHLEAIFSGKDVSATTMMAAGAAISFILAAAYFLRIVHNAGWLTPTIQLVIATLSAGAFIVAGFVMAEQDRRYASWLPSVGVVILYLTVYAGHLHYGLLPHMVAVVAVAAISIGALVLGYRFQNGFYGILAAGGVYLTPLLVSSLPDDLVGLLIYFTAWSLLFSFLSIQEGKRTTYLVAMYMAILSFDAAWRSAGEPHWQLAAVYQFLQFLVFAGTAVFFSVRYKKLMKNDEAVAHGLPLFYFYFVEYLMLNEYAPGLAPLLALVSVGVVIGGWMVAVKRLPEAAATAAAGLVSAYASFVTAHILMFHWIPTEWLPWAALVLPVGLAIVYDSKKLPRVTLLPIAIVCGFVVLCAMFLSIASDAVDVDVPFPSGALLGYAVAIYVAYWKLSGHDTNQELLPGLLYAGHATLMVSTIRLFESGLVISISWAIFAVALLVYALQAKDRLAGQSSLLVFGASAVKVLMYDLSGSPSIVRVITLVVVGASLYAGGWLYQSLVKTDEDEPQREFHSDPTINGHLKMIHRLILKGLDNSQIAQRLKRANVRCASRRGWTPRLVEQVREKYELG